MKTYEELLKAKIEYYGNTEVARQTAAEQLERNMRDLLIKYMAHVIRMEGYTFVEDMDMDSKLTADEMHEIKAVEIEAKKFYDEHINK